MIVTSSTVGVLENSATVRGTQTDPNMNNNTSIAQTTVQAATGGPIDLAQTGQQNCYDPSGTQTPCAGTGHDGEIRAGISWPSPRFTVNGDCVTDNLTGLTWLRSPDSTLRTWQEALDHSTSFLCAGMMTGVSPTAGSLEA